MSIPILENLIKKNFISPKDLCQVFDISIPTVYRLIASRQIKTYKIGKSLRISRDDIIEYAEKNRMGRIK